jgi:hypothetical protein
VGVAGNGVGLLNGQTTKQDFIASVEGVGWGVVCRVGVEDTRLHHQVYLGHVLKVFREPIRGFQGLLRQKPHSLLILLSVEFNLNGIPNNAVPTKGRKATELGLLSG